MVKVNKLLAEKQSSFFKDQSNTNLQELERAFRDIYQENELMGEIANIQHIKIQKTDLKSYLNKRYHKRFGPKI